MAEDEQESPQEDEEQEEEIDDELDLDAELDELDKELEEVIGDDEESPKDSQARLESLEGESSEIVEGDSEREESTEIEGDEVSEKADIENEEAPETLEQEEQKSIADELNQSEDTETSDSEQTDEKLVEDDSGEEISGEASEEGVIVEGSQGEGVEEGFEEEISEEQSEEQKLKNTIEGALFVAGRPVSVEELNIKTGIGKRDLRPLLDELMMDYLMRPTALEIIQIQDKYSLQIKAEYTPKVKRFASTGLIPDKYLKTLTIIALKQPIMKSKLVKLRGSTAYQHVKFLEENGFIDSKKKGRSSELTTTDTFADTFGLSRDLKVMKRQLVEQLGVKQDLT